MERPEIDIISYYDNTGCVAVDWHKLQELEKYADHLESQLEKLRTENEEQNKTIGKLLDEATKYANENEDLKAEKQELIERIKIYESI